MWYYKKDGNIIGPASARKIVSMRELGIITDSTPVSRKRNAKNWETFGGLSEKINLESSQWDRQSLCTIRACKKYNDFEGATGINNSRNVRFNILHAAKLQFARRIYKRN